MKRTSLHAALVTGLLLGAAMAPSAMAADAKPPPLTKGVAAALSDSQKAFAKQDFQGSLAAVQKAQAVSDLTPYDKLMIDRFLMQTQIALKDLNAADVAAEDAADSDPSIIPDADKAAIYKPALQLALNSKHYDKAMKYAKLLQALGPQDAQTNSFMLQAYFFGGDTATATAMAQKNVDAATAAGKVPDRNDYEMIMSGQVKAKDEAGAEKTLEQLIANYNDPDDWAQLISVTFGTKGIRDIDAVYLGRLMFLVDTKITANDASLVGGTASHLGLYGDVIQAEKLGGTGFTPPEANAAADKKTLPQQIAAGAKQNGNYNVKLGEALYGYGMFPEAEAAARAAIQKGGAADASEPQMLLGMSLAAQSKYADALAAFQQVQGGGPATPRIVRLWTYYVKSKTGGATAPAAAPAQ